jgi:hypothetical protein
VIVAGGTPLMLHGDRAAPTPLDDVRSGQSQRADHDLVIRLSSETVSG